MRKVLFTFLAGILLACTAAAQSQASREQEEKKRSESKASASGSASAAASAKAGDHSASLSGGTTFEAALSKSLSARKNKEGDRVEARTTSDVKSEGKVVIPKNSKLIGHVTQAQARAEGQSESALGIAFDRCVTKDGREIPIHVVIQAIAQAQTAAAATPAESDLMSSASGSASGAAPARPSAGSSGGLVGGVTSTVGATAGAATGAVGATTNTAGSLTAAAGGLDASGVLNSSSAGVIGLKGLTLNSEAASATQGSVISSSTKNVRLDSGTRILLRAVGQ